MKFINKSNWQRLFGLTLFLAGSYAVYLFFLRQSSLPSMKDEIAPAEIRQPLEKALTVTDQNLISVPLFEKVIKNNARELSLVFFRISSGVSFKCDKQIQTCRLNGRGARKTDFLPYLEILKKFSIPVAVIYDLNIDNYRFRIGTYRGEEYSKRQETVALGRPIFSNTKYKRKIIDDFKNSIKEFGAVKIVFGSDLDFYFHSIWGKKTSQSEVTAFWSILKKIKSEYPEIAISTALNYEHLRYYNYLTDLNRGEIAKLDFLAFNSHPLHPGWTWFPKFDAQMLGFSSKVLDLNTFNYYTFIRQKIGGDQNAYLIDFGYPEDESQEQNRALMIQYLKANPVIKGVSWALTSFIDGDTPEARYHNMLSIVDKNGDLNAGGKLFFSQKSKY